MDKSKILQLRMCFCLSASHDSYGKEKFKTKNKRKRNKTNPNTKTIWNRELLKIKIKYLEKKEYNDHKNSYNHWSAIIKMNPTTDAWCQQ